MLLGALSGALKKLADGSGGDVSVGKGAHRGKRCSFEESVTEKRGARCDSSCMASSASPSRGWPGASPFYCSCRRYKMPRAARSALQDPF